MPRVLVPKTEGAAAAANDRRDNGLDRLAKYLPAETLPLYVLVESPLKKQNPTEIIAGLYPNTWMWVVGIILMILNIGYLASMYRSKYGGRMPTKVTRTHYTTSTIAFIIYTYADALPIWGNIYHPVIAGIVIVLFAAIAGLFVDPQVTPEQDQNLNLP